MRHLSLVVLFVVAALAAMPAAAAAGPADCAGVSPAVSVVGAADPAGAEALFSPANKPQDKACIISCQLWGYSTSMHRGTGSDCTASTNNLRSSVGSDASSIGPGVCSDSAFGYCGFNLVITVSCHWDFVLGTYVTDGYGEIKCRDYC